MTSPDVFAKIHFLSTSEEGRKGLTPPDFFSCVFIFNNNNYDCRLLLNEIGMIYPGDTKDRVPVKFLLSEIIRERLNIGDKFYLREHHIFSEGEIVEICHETTSL